MKWEYNWSLSYTMNKIMEYLTEKLADGDKFISYRVIAKEVKRSYHSVKYSIEQLEKKGMIKIIDNKLSIA